MQANKIDQKAKDRVRHGNEIGISSKRYLTLENPHGQNNNIAQSSKQI